jgi:hypothetical protein
VKSVDTAPGLERLREPGFQKLSKLCCMRSTPTEMQSMNENDFECLAKTRVNTPPMAKMTDDVQPGSYRFVPADRYRQRALVLIDRSSWSALRSSFDKIVRMRQLSPNLGPIWVW